MDANPFWGVILHAVGGLAAASFYIPYKRVNGWAWENYWLVGGLFSWVIAPWVLALVILPQTVDILREAPRGAMLWAYGFGVLWGVGGLTFGLTMRYLGIALGYAIALGLCAAFGTLVPPIFSGEFLAIASSWSGQVILLGVLICLVGITLSGKAGVLKERDLSAAQKKASVGEFNFMKGLLLAIFAGVTSAAMAYGFAAGKPIAALAIEQGAPPLWQNLPVLIVVLFGGFTTNFLWCAGLIFRKAAWGQYLGRGAVAGGGDEAMPPPARIPLGINYLFCAIAGVTWYLQFFFYGMGTTQMGKYDFSSWTLHMASIIIFSTLWGIALKEWRGTSRATHRWIGLGLALLILSTIVIGYGNNQGVAAGPDSTEALHE